MGAIFEWPQKQPLFLARLVSADLSPHRREVLRVLELLLDHRQGHTDACGTSTDVQGIDAKQRKHF